MKQLRKINFQNIQAAHTTQFQKNKKPNQKVGKRHKHFCKDIRIANKHMKRCSTLFIIRKNENQNYNEISPHTGQNQFSSVVQSCPTFCDPMNCSMPGLPVHHQLPESTQTHVHWVSDANSTISSSVVPFSSCPQSFPASGSFPMSQFFASGGQGTVVSASTSVLPVNTQD